MNRFGRTLTLVVAGSLVTGVLAADDSCEMGVFKNGDFFLGCNYWASHAGVYMWRDWRPEILESDLDKIAAHGMTVMRVFPLWPDFQPLTADFGAGQRFVGYSQRGEPIANEAGVDETMMGRFRFLCDAAEKRGIRLIVGLVTGWMSGRTFVPTAFERMKVLENPEAIKWEVRFVRHFVRAFRNHRAVLAWDLGNECNCLGASSEAALWAWMHQITSEIRLNDPTRPVVSGMHGYSTRANAYTNMRQQGELTDVLTTHPYPLWTPKCNTEPFDTIRNGCHAACETTLYANLGGKPAFVEEAGSMGPQIVSEERAAASMRMALFSCWANGIPGYVWWCGFDQDRLTHAPYDWTAIERELGLFKSDGTPKPTAVQLREFRTFLDGLPFKTLPPRRIDATVVLSEKEDAWPTAQGAWLLARRAGFDIRYARAEDELPESNFYILPSPLTDKYNAYSRRAFWRVIDKAKDGSTVLITLGNGAILSDLEEVAGVKTENHFAARSELRLEGPDGAFTVPDAYTRQVSCVGAQAVLKDAAGSVVMTVKTLGKGRIVFFNGALESNAPLAGWPIYEKAAECAGIRRRVRCNCRDVGITEHVLDNDETLVVAVNYSQCRVDCNFEANASISRIFRGVCTEGKWEIPANDAVVFSIGNKNADDINGASIGS